jgi:hypothetical protein
MLYVYKETQVLLHIERFNQSNGMNRVYYSIPSAMTKLTLPLAHPFERAPIQAFKLGTAYPSMKSHLLRETRKNRIVSIFLEQRRHHPRLLLVYN